MNKLKNLAIAFIHWLFRPVDDPDCYEYKPRRERKE